MNSITKQISVYVVDRFICGTEELCWIKKAILLKNHSRLKLPDLPEELRKCYQVHDVELHDLLLSPRARYKTNGDYLCCSQCFKSFRNDNLDSNPPRFAISNNFAIGSLPARLGELVTEITSPLLALVRPFAYVASFSGGAHKAISGSFSFFSQSVANNLGALNTHSNIAHQNNIFVILTGNFTPVQRQIIKSRCLVDINNLKEIYGWLQKNNTHYYDLPEFHKCPSPTIIEDEDSCDEISENPTVEKHIEIKYWFPNNGDPTSSNSVFNSQSEFIDSLLKNKEPTLIFNSKNYAVDHKLTLPILFPLHFPFGTGGFEEVRRTHVSVEECLRHYLKISLPMFQHADIILVIAHMYFRKKSFQSAYLRCMSKSSFDGLSRGETLSRITEEEIMSISKTSRLDTPVEGQVTANNLIHTVTASCKSLPFCDESAKEARSKLFSMWYTFGPPAVFFTISPGDECSFRIKLCINTTMTLLPQFDVPENECVADLLYRSQIRINNPGACAREYNCIMQIIMECLIGWDFIEKQQKNNGIFGKVLAWCDTTEEQARYTLHSHVLLFIHEFDEVINLLWSEEESVRCAAKSELVEYMKLTMSASYNLLEEDYLHEKTEPLTSSGESANDDFDISTKSDKNDCCRIIPKAVCKANLFKMRHERCCHVFKGLVAKCEGCSTKFSTRDLVWNAVRAWNKQFEDTFHKPFFLPNHPFPSSKEIMERIALRYPYDMDYLRRFPNDKLKRILFTIILNHYNEHDYRHRKGCFKKGEECRFHYPKYIHESNEVNIDYKVEASTWFSSYGNGNNKLCFPFTLDPRRELPDVYLNTHNVTVSEIFGYNNNVAMGNRNCIYYVTLYSTKGNQEEEQFPFLRHCTAIAKRLKRLRDLQNQLAEQLVTNGLNGEREDNTITNFNVGLGHVLSGIMAHISTSVLSATLAWHLVINDSRFTFSHDFSHILLSQFEGWLMGEDINYRYRRNKNKGVGWMDSNVFQYIYRPMREEFESTCVWEFFQKYEMRLISSLTSNQRENLDNDFEENIIFRFSEQYPGYEFACCETMKNFKVPMLYYNDHIPDLEDCCIGHDECTIDDRTKTVRNNYATKMLILFYPFREKSDFPTFEERWMFFINAHENGLLYSDATKIMQNFQDVENSKKIIAKPELQKEIELHEMEIDTDFQIHNDESLDITIPSEKDGPTVHDHDGDLEMIFEEFGIVNEYENGINGSIQEHVCGNLKSTMKKLHIIDDPVCSEESIFLSSLQTPEGTQETNDNPIMESVERVADNLDIITVIFDVDRTPTEEDPKWEDLERNGAVNFKEYPLAMKSCIKHFNLDMKQASAFRVICSTFMLAHLHDPLIRKSISDSELEKAENMLKKMGGMDRLIMNLTGSGGSGKSFVLESIKSFCKQFCRAINKPFNESVFIITATTNTAAALLKGDTIHSIAGLRRKESSILKKWTINWALAKILFIDEISMMDISDFLKLDRYLRRLMAQFNPVALDVPFGGLSIIFCGDFSQLNPVGQKHLIYDTSKNVLWNLINRQINLTLGNWRFRLDQRWGDTLNRLHHGEATKEDIELINTRVIGPNLALPTIEELQGGEISYACYTNADRNLITDNIFARILECRHPKSEETGEIPKQTIIIKGNFYKSQNNEPKSQTFHKLIHGNCGDDNVLCGNGQNIVRVDPCLKLYVGCPIMVSVNDFKKDGVVKGTTGKFMGVVLKAGKCPAVEIWNGYKVNTVEASDVKEIVCEYTNCNSANRTFSLPMKEFEVSVKFPMGHGKRFFTLKNLKVTQFPINNDLATTGHKLQGMTKKYLIVSQLNYSTSNWIYVVLSRVTTLDGLFLLQPLKLNFNPKPSKLLREEWVRQRDKEIELLKFLQDNGNLPEDLDVQEIALKLTVTHQNQQTNSFANSELLIQKTTERRRKKSTAVTSASDSTPDTQYIQWFATQKLVIRSDLSERKGNCLFDSVSSFFPQWRGKSLELRFVSINWAKNEVMRGSTWGIKMWQDFDNTEGNCDRYTATNYMEYLTILSDHRVFATEYDVIMLSEFLKIAIKVYTPTRFTVIDGKLYAATPSIIGIEHETTISLWLRNLHYEPIMDN